jgi:DDE family transposase
MQEIVTDKGYYSGAVLAEMAEWGVRTYVAEPKQGRRKWTGKGEQQAAVYANRRRIGGGRGKALLRQRGERLERSFAHQFESGALRRLQVRGRNNVLKKLLLLATVCNLGLLLRTLVGAGTPRALQDGVAALLFAIWGALGAQSDASRLPGAVADPPRLNPFRHSHSGPRNSRCRKRGGSDTGC